MSHLYNNDCDYFRTISLDQLVLETLISFIQISLWSTPYDLKMTQTLQHQHSESSSDTSLMKILILAPSVLDHLVLETSQGSCHLQGHSYRCHKFCSVTFVHCLTLHVQDIVNVTESNGVFVQVRAGIDVINEEATWELQALDPETGI